MNTYKGTAGGISTGYFQMIKKNDQVKDKFMARIDKGKKFQKNLKDTLKGSTLTAGTLYRCGAAVLGKGIWEYNK